ncbi:MAG: helix-turn-helix domain-containing protein [Thermomicrobiales bacterium]
MTPAELAALQPAIHRAYSWNRKASFALREDRSGLWVAFAIEDGSFEYGIGEHRGIASFGDVILCPPNVPFRRRIVTPLTFHHVIFSWLDRKSGEPVEPVSLDLCAIVMHDTNRLATTYAHLRRVANTSDGHTDTWTSHLFDDIWLTHCAEVLQNERETPRQHSDDLMVRARHIIERDYAERPSLAALAASLGLSPMQFTRRYRAAFGTTPMHDLSQVRLDEAQMLLLESNLSLDQIARRCGYTNGFYLSRVFTRWFGESPSRFRASRRI